MSDEVPSPLQLASVSDLLNELERRANATDGFVAVAFACNDTESLQVEKKSGEPVLRTWIRASGKSEKAFKFCRSLVINLAHELHNTEWKSEDGEDSK